MGNERQCVFFLELFKFEFPAVHRTLAAHLKLEQNELGLSPAWPRADFKTHRESSLRGQHEMSLQERLNGLIMSY